MALKFAIAAHICGGGFEGERVRFGDYQVHCLYGDQQQRRLLVPIFVILFVKKLLI